MAELNLIYQPAVHGSDPQWEHDLGGERFIAIQDARAYGGNLVVGIWDGADGCLYHCGEECTEASAQETAARVLDLITENNGNVEAAHAAFHAVQS